MGNLQSAKDFCDNKKTKEGFVLPKKFFHFQGHPNVNWLCGGPLPSNPDVFNFLEAFGVKVIVTLLLEPVKIGWNINHLNEKFELTNYFLLEQENKEFVNKFSWYHLSIPDKGIPTEEDFKNFAGFLDNWPKSVQNKIYIHCWDGLNRTFFMLSWILMKYGNWTSDQVYNIFNKTKMSVNQNSYLTGVPIAEDKIILKKILTPPDAECYMIPIYQWLVKTRKQKGYSINQLIKFFGLTPDPYLRRIFSVNGPLENLRCLKGKQVTEILAKWSHLPDINLPTAEISLEEKLDDYILDNKLVFKNIGLSRLEPDFSTNPPKVKIYVKRNSWINQVLIQYDFETVKLTISNLEDFPLKEWEALEIAFLN